MRRSITFLLLALAFATRPGPLADEALLLVDRIVAVVDEDPILLSDIRRAVAFGLVEAIPGEDPTRRDRRVLDGLIDQRLRLHEVERHDFSPIPPEEVDRQVERIRAGFDDPAELRRNLERLGLNDDGLALLVARQLRVLIYVEKRLGPRVFIRTEDIRAYYDDVLTPEMARRGQEPPPLVEVREGIRDILYEKEINAEIDAWTEELRLEADVVDYLDRAATGLPPVVERLEE